jgi:RNA polymerase sigma-70 factor (ECF subfamily)
MDALIPDEELVRRTLAGEALAFELIVGRYTPGVWRYARFRLRDAADADEVTSDTFLNAHRNLVHVRDPSSSLRSWLLRICHRLCVDRIRRRRPTTVPPDDSVLSVIAVLKDRHQQRVAELRWRLRQEIATLPDEEREALTLVCVHGYSREEAAEILGIPSPTIRARVIRARDRLARNLNDCRAEPGEG